MIDVQIKDVMTKRPVVIDSEEIVTRVDEIFKESDFHHIPVTDQSGKLTGMVSRSDFDRIGVGVSIFKKQNTEEYNQAMFRAMQVCDIMTKNVLSLHPDDNIEKAYQIFSYNKFRALPVCDREEVVGIVTPLDLLAHFFNTK